MKFQVVQQIVTFKTFEIEAESIEEAQDIASEDFTLENVETVDGYHFDHSNEIVVHTQVFSPENIQIFCYDREEM